MACLLNVGGPFMVRRRQAKTRTEFQTHTHKKPEGGFRFINAEALLTTWMMYRRGVVQFMDLRVWFGCWELTSRRCSLRKGQRPRYTVEEIHRLVGGVGGEYLRNSIARLERAGLLSWQESAVQIQPSPDQLPVDLREELGAKLDLIANHRRKVPVPRRVIRLIAKRGKRVEIATIVGHLLRCLYYRDGRCVPDGRCKASWVAEVFEVDLRNVKAARKHLIAQGWLIPRPSSQSQLNRWGPMFTVNLAWSPKPGRQKLESPPPSPVSTSQIPPPIENKKLSTRSKNQEPAPRGPAGSWKEAGKENKPNIRHVVSEDLRESGRLDVLFSQAVTRGYVQQSECDRLRFFGAAEHARAVATHNPCGLFATVVRQRLWHHITQRDEDAARARLKAVDAPVFAVWPKPKTRVTATALLSLGRSGATVLGQQCMVRTTAERFGGKAPTTPSRFSSASEVLAAAGIGQYCPEGTTAG